MFSQGCDTTINQYNNVIQSTHSQNQNGCLQLYEKCQDLDNDERFNIAASTKIKKSQFGECLTSQRYSIYASYIFSAAVVFGIGFILGRKTMQNHKLEPTFKFLLK